MENERTRAIIVPYNQLYLALIVTGDGQVDRFETLTWEMAERRFYTMHPDGFIIPQWLLDPIDGSYPTSIP